MAQNYKTFSLKYHPMIGGWERLPPGTNVVVPKLIAGQISEAVLSTDILPITHVSDTHSTEPPDQHDMKSTPTFPTLTLLTKNVSLNLPKNIHYVLAGRR